MAPKQKEKEKQAEPAWKVEKSLSLACRILSSFLCGQGHVLFFSQSHTSLFLPAQLYQRWVSLLDLLKRPILEP